MIAIYLIQARVLLLNRILQELVQKRAVNIRIKSNKLNNLFCILHFVIIVAVTHIVNVYFLKFKV